MICWGHSWTVSWFPDQCSCPTPSSLLAVMSPAQIPVVSCTFLCGLHCERPLFRMHTLNHPLLPLLDLLLEIIIGTISDASLERPSKRAIKCWSMPLLMGRESFSSLSIWALFTGAFKWLEIMLATRLWNRLDARGFFSFLIWIEHTVLGVCADSFVGCERSLHVFH